MQIEFCPYCFMQLERQVEACPGCGKNISQYKVSASFDQRLIRALRHPVDDVRMRVIFAIRKRGVVTAIDSLLTCAFNQPADIVQNLEIIATLKSFPPSVTRDAALARLATSHLSELVRKAAR